MNDIWPTGRESMIQNHTCDYLEILFQVGRCLGTLIVQIGNSRWEFQWLVCLESRALLSGLIKFGDYIFVVYLSHSTVVLCI